MGPSRKRGVDRSDPDDQEIREQEVLRANRELAAYFRGRRTEREARAALKIVKAFIRDRERIDPASRRPLPGAASTPVNTSTRTPKTSLRSDVRKPRRPLPPDLQEKIAKDARATDASARHEPVPSE